MSKPSMVKPTLIRATLDGAECLADKDCSHAIEKSHEPSLQDDYRDNPNFREVPHKNYNFSCLKDTHDLGIRKESSLTYTVKQKEVPLKQVHRNLEMQNSSNEHSIKTNSKKQASKSTTRKVTWQLTGSKIVHRIQQTNICSVDRK